MANFFDQFDQPNTDPVAPPKQSGGNFFDQFDEPAVAVEVPSLSGQVKPDNFFNQFDSPSPADAPIAPVTTPVQAAPAAQPMIPPPAPLKPVVQATNENLVRAALGVKDAPYLNLNPPQVIPPAPGIIDRALASPIAGSILGKAEQLMSSAPMSGYNQVAGAVADKLPGITKPAQLAAGLINPQPQPDALEQMAQAEKVMNLGRDLALKLTKQRRPELFDSRIQWSPETVNDAIDATARRYNLTTSQQLHDLQDARTAYGDAASTGPILHYANTITQGLADVVKLVPGLTIDLPMQLEQMKAQARDWAIKKFGGNPDLVPQWAKTPFSSLIQNTILKNEEQKSVGGAIQERVDRAVPLNPEYEKDWYNRLATDIVRAAPNMALFYAAGLATAGTPWLVGQFGGNATRAAGAVTSALGAGMQMQSSVEQLLQKEDETLLESVLLLAGQGALGATEAIPVMDFLGRMNKVGGKRLFTQALASKLRSPLGKVTKQTFLQALEEAGQEYGQSFYEEMLNWLADNYASAKSQDERQFWDMIADAGAKGFRAAQSAAILGGTMGGAGQVNQNIERRNRLTMRLEQLKGRVQTKEAIEKINQIIKQIETPPDPVAPQFTPVEAGQTLPASTGGQAPAQLVPTVGGQLPEQLPATTGEGQSTIPTLQTAPVTPVTPPTIQQGTTNAQQNQQAASTNANVSVPGGPGGTAPLRQEAGGPAGSTGVPGGGQTPESVQGQETDVQRAESVTKLRKQWDEDSNFRNAIVRAILPVATELNKNDYEYLAFDVPNDENASYSLKRKFGTDDVSELYAYRSPNRPAHQLIGVGEIEPGVNGVAIDGKSKGALDTFIITDKPLSPEKIQNWELVTVSGSKSRESLGLQIAMALSGDGPAHMVRNANEKDMRGVLITPSAQEQGKWQASEYDRRGFYTHSVHDTKEDAIKKKINEGFTPTSENWADRFSQGEDWKEGVKALQFRRIDDKLLNDEPARQRLWSVSAKDGIDAAIKWGEDYLAGKIVLTGSSTTPSQPSAVTPKADEVWANVPVEQESRWFGTKVDVAPEGAKDEPWSGTVIRVLNNGSLLEVRPDGQEDGSFRIGRHRVSITSLVDNAPPAPTSAASVTPVAPTTPSAVVPPKTPATGTAADQEAAPEVQDPKAPVSKSGRKLSPYPSIRVKSERSAKVAIRKGDEWLINEVLNEAKANNDDFIHGMFSRELPVPSEGLPQASRDAANEYLFGRTSIKFSNQVDSEIAPVQPQRKLSKKQQARLADLDGNIKALTTERDNLSQLIRGSNKPMVRTHRRVAKLNKGIERLKKAREVLLAPPVKKSSFRGEYTNSQIENELKNAFVGWHDDLGGSAVEQMNVYAENLAKDESITFVGDPGMSIHPDDLKNQSPIVRERLKDYVNEDNANILIEKNPKLYQKALDELIDSKEQRFSRFVDGIIANKDMLDDSRQPLVLKAYLYKRWPEMTPEERNVEREIVDPSELPEGTTVRIHGEQFTVTTNKHGERVLRDGIDLPAERLTAVPIEKGSLNVPPGATIGTEQGASNVTTSAQPGQGTVSTGRPDNRSGQDTRTAGTDAATGTGTRPDNLSAEVRGRPERPDPAQPQGVVGEQLDESEPTDAEIRQSQSVNKTDAGENIPFTVAKMGGRPEVVTPSRLVKASGDDNAQVTADPDGGWTITYTNGISHRVRHVDRLVSRNSFINTMVAQHAGYTVVMPDGTRFTIPASVSLAQQQFTQPIYDQLVKKFAVPAAFDGNTGDVLLSREVGLVTDGELQHELGHAAFRHALTEPQRNVIIRAYLLPGESEFDRNARAAAEERAIEDFSETGPNQKVVAKELLTMMRDGRIWQRTPGPFNRQTDGMMFATRERLSDQQLTLGGESTGRATVGGTGNLFGNAPIARPKQVEPAIKIDRSQIGKFGITESDLRLAAVYSTGTPSAAFAYGVKEYQVNKRDNPVKPDGTTKIDRDDIAAGFAAAKRGANQLTQADRAETKERTKESESDRQTGTLFTTRELPDGRKVTVKTDIDALGLYSQLERSIGSFKDPKMTMTGRQWAQWASKQQGVKQGEIKWSGLDEITDRKMTRDEVVEYLKANNIRVEQVVKGERSESTEDIARRLYGKEWIELTDEQRKEANRQSKDAAKSDTKFSQYQTPGGENYGETLLVMPEKNRGVERLEQEKQESLLALIKAFEKDSGRPRNEAIEISQAARKGTQRFVDMIRAAMGDARADGMIKTARDAKDAYDSAFAKRADSTFRSSHFDEPNILVHVRHNDRTDAKGNRVLFIEEYQSDWNQKGREEGYVDPEAGKKIQRLDAERVRLEEASKPYREKGEDAPSEIVERWTAVKEEIDRITRASSSAVPPNPFMDTAEWVGLATRRMIRYAAENGYEGIAWTTGEMQARRYPDELRKVADQIQWNTDESGIKEFFVKKNGGTILSGLIDSDTGLIRDATVDKANGETLDKVLGKGMAEKVSASANGEIKGKDFTVGAGGMTAFYDSIVPSVANKIGKKWGVQVGTTTILTVNNAVPTYDDNGTRTDDGGYETMTVPFIPITPAMRESVMAEGLPRFSIAGWHGTPHEWEGNRADISKIGTGEGAQAYGFGLYFSGRREVAQHYRDSLSRIEVDGTPLHQTSMRRGSKEHLEFTRGDIDRAIGRAESLVDYWTKDEPSATRLEAAKDDLDELIALKKLGRKITAPGNLYEVELAPNEDELLDWDRPLSQQSEKVKKALEQIPNLDIRVNHGMPLKDKSLAWNTAGSDLYKSLYTTAGVSIGIRSPKDASTYLKSLGIRGIRYLDGTSRYVGSQYSAVFADGRNLTEEDSRVIEKAEYALSKHNGNIKAAAKDLMELAADKPPGDWTRNWLTNAARGLMSGKIVIRDTRSYNYVIFSDEDITVKNKYARRRPRPGPLSTADSVRKLSDSMAVKVPGAVRTIVVQKASDLAKLDPSGYAEIQRQGIEDAVEGYARNNVVYLVADNLVSPARAEQVWLHEQVGHVGVSKVLNDEARGALSKMIGGRMAEQANSTAQRYFGKEFSRLTEPQRADLLDEIIAQAAEQADENPSVWTRLAAFIRTALRKMGFTVKLTDGDIKAMVAQGRKAMSRATAGRSRQAMSLKRNPQIETPEFKRWFGDSKVVDDQGRPLVVNHQTWNEFTVFDRMWAASEFKRDPQSIDRVGIWFTDDQNTSLYGPKNLEVFLSLQNPKVFEDDPVVERKVVVLTPTERRQWEKWKTMVNEGGIKSLPVSDRQRFKELDNKEWESRSEAPLVINSTLAWHKLNDEIIAAGGADAYRIKLREQGYDGIQLKNTKTDQTISSGKTHNMWIALDSTQIKSATGNIGSYGQRPVTAAEAQSLGMTEEQANDAQKAGDIRLTTREDQDQPFSLPQMLVGLDEVGNQLATPLDQVLSSPNTIPVAPDEVLSLDVVDPKAARNPTEAPEVVNALKEVVLAAGKEVPIRIGRNRKLGKSALGLFKVGPEVIRLQAANDITTAAHEVAHALEKAMYGYPKGGPWVPKATGVNKTMQQELTELGKALYGSTRPQGGYKREGFAEYLRLWITKPQIAKQKAPTFDAFFHSVLLKDLPDVSAALTKARELARKWDEQGAKARVAASVFDPASAPARVNRAIGWLKDFASKRNLVETSSPLARIADAANEILKGKLSSSDNSYRLAIALRQTQYGVVREWVEGQGITDIATNVVGRPLGDIRALVKGKQLDFTLYLLARRAYKMLTDPKGKRDPGVSLEDAKYIIKELGSPDFELAASQVYEWNNHVLDYYAQSSPANAATVRAIRNRDPGDYVPLQREFAEAIQFWNQSIAGGHGNPLKRLRGSGRRVKDPFQSMISNAESMVAAAHRQMIMDSVIRISKLPGMGSLVEKIDAGMVPVSTKTIDDLIDQINRQLNRMNQPQLTTESPIDQKALESTITQFAHAQTIKSKPDEAIIPYYNNGQMEFYQVHKDIYRTLADQDLPRLGVLGELIFGLPASIFRAGTTGVRASFGLVTNPFRDIQTLYMNTQSRGIGGQLFGRYMTTLLRASLGRIPLTPSSVEGEWLALFKRLGGEMAQPMGQDFTQTRRAARRLFEGRVIRMVDFRNWFDIYRDFVQTPESVPRAVELQAIADQVGWKPGTPMTLDQRIDMTIAAAQVTTDFRAGGEFARMMNRAIPFFNAQIQGPRASLRAARRNPAAFILKGLTAVTIPTLLLWWLYKDEEWYKQMQPWEKFGYWHIPLDWPEPTLIRIPRAFEVGTFFSAMPEAMVDAWYQQDPTAVNEWFAHALGVLNPMALPVLANVAAEQLKNKSFFTNRPIVPRGELDRPAEEQKGEYTTRASVFLGEKIGISPRRLDHAIKGIFGPVAMDVLDLTRVGRNPPNRDRELSDTPVMGHLFQRGGYIGNAPRDIDALYDAYSQAITKQRSLKNPENESERLQRLKLADAVKAIGAMSDVRRDVSDNEKRQAITREMIQIAKDAIKTNKETSTRASRPEAVAKMNARLKELEVKQQAEMIEDQEKVELRRLTAYRNRISSLRFKLRKTNDPIIQQKLIDAIEQLADKSMQKAQSNTQ